MIDLFSMWQFYAGLIGVSMFGWGLWKSLSKGIPVVNRLQKQHFMGIGIVGLLIVSGVLGSFGTGSLTTKSGVSITDFQVTTDFTSDIGASPVEDDTIDDLIHVRMTDAQVNETDTYEELASGVILVRRGGQGLDPVSVPVWIETEENFKSQKTPGDGNSYTILEENAKGELEAYIRTCSTSSCASATTYPKERSSLAFADGVDTGYVGLMMEVDEEAHDELNQYGYKDVRLHVGNKVLTVRMHRMD